MKKAYILGLFSNFDEAIALISDIRKQRVPGVSVADISVVSPIEHPAVVELLGERPCHVRKFTLVGALTGASLGFTWLISAQASFLVQPQGGKPVVPIPSNLVLTYEMFILCGVLFTLAGFLIGARLIRRDKRPYSEKVSVDQVGIELELDEKYVEPVKRLFAEHQALEIREGVAG